MPKKLLKNDLIQQPSQPISQAQRERLVYIEFKLRFLGLMNRQDLIARFGIQSAAATRDIATYKSLATNNIAYNAKARVYTPAADFNPIFKHTEPQLLALIWYELGLQLDDQPLILTENATRLSATNTASLAMFTRAIYGHKALDIEYHSMTSGLSKRVIVPFALANNGLRWHARAYDRKSGQFRDFLINRAKPIELLEERIPRLQTKDADDEWNRIVELHLVPHPKIEHPETIALEYAMTNGVLKVKIRAAMASYILRLWNVDSTDNASREGGEFNLWLQNRMALYGISDFTIAPT